MSLCFGLRPGALGHMVAGTILLASAAHAETLVGTTYEGRTLLGFNAPVDAIAPMLPDGWEPVVLPAGGMAGANVILVLMDRHLMLDANGEPNRESSNPAAGLFAYARHPDVEGIRGFIVKSWEEPPLDNVYVESTEADIHREAGFVDEGAGDRVLSEHWTIADVGGGAITVDLEAAGVNYAWSSGESRPFSAANPDFFRIYKYSQLAGVVLSEAMGRPIQGSVSVTSTEADTAKILEGTGPVAVISMPTYVREIWLP